MTRLLSYFTGLKGYAAVAVLALLLGSGGTWRVMSWKEAAGETQAAHQTVRLVEHQANITYQISATYEAVKSNVEAQTRKRVDDIPSHISVMADNNCTVPLGYVRLYNAATHGPIPDASSGPDDESAGITLSTVAKTDIENAGQYDVLAAQLTALQTWVKQQQAAAPQ